MRESIVFFPGPSFHHMVSMVELGKLILQHQPHFSITILVTTMPSDTSTTISYINRISQINNNLPISFISLPSIHLPPPDQDSDKTQTRATVAFQFIRLNIPHALDAIRTISLTSSVVALMSSVIIHAFTNVNLHIPIYFHFTSCASALALLLYLPTIHNQTTKSFKDLHNTLFDIPGLPPIKASHMPQPLLDRDNLTYHEFLNNFSGLTKSKGIIINTFDLLEPQAIKAIAHGACVPNGVTPPVYSIGPLITDARDQFGSGTSHDTLSESLAWLDAQPKGSVVFLCFGSQGTFSEAQLEEIATGLERSKQRFLWVVKSPQGITTDPNLEELLPKGFLERTKESGLVVKSWAPQNAILRHESVGGFVTHCGWNSLLEAVKNGVPMVAWPLYAEQHVNSVVFVEEMKLAIAIDLQTSSKEGGEEGLVSAEEVEKRLRQLMELEEGKVLRKRSLEMKAMAMAAWSTSGGSSFTDFSKLVGSWKQG